MNDKEEAKAMWERLFCAAISGAPAEVTRHSAAERAAEVADKALSEWRSRFGTRPGGSSTG